MYTVNRFLAGPEFTPKPIKRLIFWTCFISILSALTNVFFHFFAVYGPQKWLALSLWGIDRYMLWQPLTCLFVLPSGAQGIQFYFLLNLVFYMLILWVIGSRVQERIGSKSFYRFYLFSGISAAILSLPALFFGGHYYQTVAGPAASLLSIFVFWGLLYPETELLLFFLFSIKAKWLVLGVVSAILLAALSQLDLVNFVFYATGVSCGYFYGLIFWGLHSPFHRMRRFEWMVLRLWQRCQIFSKKQKQEKNKVVSFPPSTQENSKDDDELFVDLMLEKIAKYGENSLTQRERKRMAKISKKKALKKR